MQKKPNTDNLIPDEKKAVTSIDGHVRSAATENELNSLFARVFRGKDGEAALRYLKSITLNNVSGPNIDPNHLMHLEGQRYIVGIINTRTDEGHKK